MTLQLRRLQYSVVPILILIVLLAMNLSMNPRMLAPANITHVLEAVTPLVLISMGMTFSILSGRGGLDMSLGPLAGMVTIVIGAYLNQGALGSPVVVVGLSLLMGGMVGLVNGCLVAVVRIQPIVATLGTYLILTGLGQSLTPVTGGSLPEWLWFGGTVLGVPSCALILIAVFVAVAMMTKTGAYRLLRSIGQDDRTVYTAAINVTAVKIVAYGLGGVLAACGGLVLASLVSGADPSVGPPYTLLAIAAVALGGTSLAGGTGGMVGTVIGAFDIYLIQNALSLAHVQVFYVTLIYGAILIVAIVSNRLLVERFTAAWDHLWWGRQHAQVTVAAASEKEK